MLKFSAALLCAQVAFAKEETIVNIAGYVPGTSVTNHSLIDLDQDEIAMGPTDEDFTDMIKWYSEGGNSVKGSGAIRTIQGFSTGLYAKACPDDECIEPWFQAQFDYFEDESYGDTIVLGALNGDGNFANVGTSFRKEVATKGAAYLIAGMYASHELEDAVADCNAGEVSDNDDGVHAWDEAVAFYAGSLEGTDDGGNSAGELQYRLAEKRCANFDTCTGSGGKSAVNSQIFGSFEAGRDYLLAGNCDDAKVEMEQIQAQFLVPQIQGTLRYAFKADPAASELNGIGDKDDDTISKEQGEAYIFAAGIIGHVNKCSPELAILLDANLGNAAVLTDTWVYSGYAGVAAGLQAIYSCLGVTCADIGGLASGDGYYEGLGPCTDAETTEDDDTEDDDDDTEDSASALAPLSALALAGFAAMMQ